MHKKISTEQYADHFTFRHLHDVLEYLAQNDNWSEFTA